jgi:hypothetical protein
MRRVSQFPVKGGMFLGTRRCVQTSGWIECSELFERIPRAASRIRPARESYSHLVRASPLDLSSSVVPPRLQRRVGHKAWIGKDNILVRLLDELATTNVLTLNTIDKYLL